jgi:hypothetical protein
MTNDDLDLFFKSPDSDHPPSMTVSVLYLLRRDIDRCMMRNECTWLATMGVFAGIDLLAKFFAGSDQGGGVTERYLAFLREYLDLTQDNAQVIYQLRNCMMHSFALTSGTHAPGRTYQFILVLNQA